MRVESMILFLVLVLAAFVFAFGAVRLLLRRTAWEAFTVEATVLAGPMLVVLVLSCGGYVAPRSVPPSLAWGLFAAGAALSLAVAALDGPDVLRLIRANASRLTVILVPAALAAGVLLVYFPGGGWNKFLYLGNGEYVNYAEMAAVLTKHFRPTAEMPFPLSFEHHRTIRFGQDLVTAVVAQVSGRNPLQAVLPLSVFYRFQYAVALGIVLWGLTGGRRPWLVAGVLLLDACLLVETFSFSTSFMSSNCTVPLLVVYLGMLNTREGVGARGAVLLAVMNVYFLVTYPEFFAVVKCFEVVQIGLWVLLRRGGLWKPWVGANVAVCLLHPGMVMRKAAFAAALAGSKAGWNIFGDPVKAPFIYLANCLGLRYAHVPDEPFGGAGWWAATTAVLVLGACVAGLCVLAWKHRLCLPVVAWVAAIALLHATPLLHKGEHFYGALKFFTQTFFVPIAALVALCDLRAPWVRRVGYAVAATWAVTAAFAAARTLPAVHHRGEVFNYAEIRDTLTRNREGRREVAVLTARPSINVLKLAAAECGMYIKPLSAAQSSWLLYGPGNEADVPLAPAEGTVFEGLIVVDAEGLSKGHVEVAHRDLKFEVDKVLGRAGNQFLCRGRLVAPPRGDLPVGGVGPPTRSESP
jgi:hypothetical protein